MTVTPLGTIPWLLSLGFCFRGGKSHTRFYLQPHTRGCRRIRRFSAFRALTKNSMFYREDEAAPEAAEEEVAAEAPAEEAAEETAEAEKESAE